MVRDLRDPRAEHSLKTSVRGPSVVRGTVGVSQGEHRTLSRGWREFRASRINLEN